MRLQFSPVERRTLAKLRSQFCRAGGTVGRQEIVPLTGHPCMMEFCENFWRARGIARPQVRDAGLFKFRSVGMHTDNFFGAEYLVLVVPLKGMGNLQHIHKGEIEDDYFDGEHALVFDDNQPHSFIARSLCYAILAGFPLEYASSAKKT